MYLIITITITYVEVIVFVLFNIRIIKNRLYNDIIL